MDKKTKRFFMQSVISIFLLCIAVFIWLTIYMGRKTERAIRNTTSIYMSEMSQQVQEKFTAVIDLRLQQVEEIIQFNPPQNAAYGEDMRKELAENAKMRNFAYAGLYAPGKKMEDLYGSNVCLLNKSGTAYMMHPDAYAIAEGQDEAGNKLLLLGKNAAYPMKGGGRSEALFVGLPMEYLSEVLFLDNNASLLYYHIINQDGNFVIRSGDAYRENYFERIRERFDKYNGKTPDIYAEELAAAMAAQEVYSASISMDGQEMYLFCKPLMENSSWYLVAGMPNNILMESVRKLDRTRNVVMVASAGMILLAMSVIFVLYYRLSQQQMKELVKARNEADHSNAAKSNFLSSMSHEIRTPMNAIIGMTEIAQRNLHDPQRVDNCLNKVRLSSKHLLGLINDVLDMSKIESRKMSLNMAPISLRDTMDDIVNIIQPQVKAKKQHFDIFIQNIMSEGVYCDDVRLNQALLNILSNAVKYTPEDGNVYIYLNQEPSPLGDTYVRTHFSVADTGMGMAPEFLDKIWDTFSREETDQVRHILGTGLGMSITKSLVDLMGGKIDVQSEIGKGSTFHITLDLMMAESVDREQMKLPKWQILVVDDDEQLCSSAVSNLELLGAECEWALNGRQAFSMVKERHEQGRDYDFILMDWQMQELDGIQTIRMIQEQVSKALKIFLISADDWSEVEEETETEQVAIEGFITKPLFASRLYERLRKYADGNEVQQPEEHKNKKDEASFDGKRVLLAEDMEINWEVANEILSSMGLKLEHAADGKECVQMFADAKEGYYDAILMDIRMPEMDGYEATRAIRALKREDSALPIIAMTADAFEGDVQKCLDNGMNDHIAKPLDIGQCVHVLNNYL
ncbi:MAG: response regulator [Eubacterium sp.]|nr:response regulator [Eubacterium sp.]